MPLATVSNVNLAGGSPVPLYTVPGGKTFVLLQCVLRGKAGSSFNGDGLYELQRASDSAQMGDQIGSIPFSADGFAVFDAPARSDINSQQCYQVFAGDGMNLVIDTPDSAALPVVDVDILGYLF